MNLLTLTYLAGTWGFFIFNIMEEIWEHIESLPNYQVSNFGRIKGLRFGKLKILNSDINIQGYERVFIKGCHHYVHRLVAKSFLKNKNANNVVNHIDGDKKNNCVNNLEWVSISENNKHAVKNGLIKFIKITPEQSNDIVKLSKTKTYKEIAFLFNIAPRRVYRIVSRLRR